MSNSKPLWKDYLTASVRTGLKAAGSFVPGVSEAIEVIETVQNRREAETRHSHTLAEISRVEKSIVEIIEREMKAVLAKLHTPNLNPKELQEEIANLYAMRNYGREPFLAEGLLVNSQWYDQLCAAPNLYGRVLQDRDVPSAECFYMFIDAEKSRLLEVSPFALQQLLSNQSKGAPEGKIIGQQDVFAERIEVVALDEKKKSSQPPPLSSVKPTKAELLERAKAGDVKAMSDYAWSIDRHNDEAKNPNDQEAFNWYQRAAELGNADAMLSVAIEYEQGRAVPASEAEAFKWYKRSADAGNMVAADTLGWMHENGFGATKDLNEAIKWYRIAADRGNSGSKKRLKELGVDL